MVFKYFSHSIGCLSFCCFFWFVEAFSFDKIPFVYFLFCSWQFWCHIHKTIAKTNIKVLIPVWGILKHVSKSNSTNWDYTWYETISNSTNIVIESDESYTTHFISLLLRTWCLLALVQRSKHGDTSPVFPDAQFPFQLCIHFQAH